MRTRVVVIAAVVGLLLLAGAGAVYAYDRAHAEEIGKGVRVGGVDVSGLTEPSRRAPSCAARVLEPLSRPVVVRAHGKRFTLTPERAQVARRHRRLRAAPRWTRSRDGNMLARTWRGIRGEPVDAELELDISYSKRAIDRLVDARRQGRRQAGGRRDRRPRERRRDAAARPRTAAGCSPSSSSARCARGCSTSATTRP